MTTPFVGRNDQWNRCAAISAAVRVVVPEYGVVGRENRSSAIAEDCIDAFVREYLHDDIRAAHDGPRHRVMARMICAGLFAHLNFRRSLRSRFSGECLLIFIALQYSLSRTRVRGSDGQCSFK
jgi:hypothetical protein